MNVEEVREYCLSHRSVTESLPFGPEALVFKVGEKMFALLSLSGDNWFNLKCDPERSIQLREEYAAIVPGYHMSKKHWNTLYLNELYSDDLIKELIDHSYDLVFNSLSKKVRDSL